MTILLLNGNSCSGKSTIIKALMKQQDRLFHLSYDALKWSFSKYNSNDYYQDVQKLVLGVAATVFKLGYDVVSDSSLYRESRDKLKALALENGYRIIEANLEANYEILSKRFDERVASALLNPERRISNLSKERFKELCDIYQREKSVDAVTFRTDIESPEEILEKIAKLLSL